MVQSLHAVLKVVVVAIASALIDHFSKANTPPKPNSSNQ